MPAEADLWSPDFAPYIARALSLVPDEVRSWMDLSGAHYLGKLDDVRNPAAQGRVLSRPQMELIAGRVSALNQCFYGTTAHSFLLRASSMMSGDAAEIRAVTDLAAAEESGLDGGASLLTFADALVAGSERELSTARERLRAELGPEVLVEAAAVASNFERMVRIADATGIPLDPMMEAGTRELRAEIGIDAFEKRA